MEKTAEIKNNQKYVIILLCINYIKLIKLSIIIVSSIKNMTKNKILNIGLIFVLSLSCFCLFNCQRKKEKTVVKYEEILFPDQEGWEETVTSSKNGVVTAVIKYGHMQHYKKTKMFEFDEGIIIDFFNDEGAHTSKLTSEKGKLNEASNDIEAYGNVVVVSDTGVTLKTERVLWNNSIEKIISNDDVMIVTVENDTMYGSGFESDQNLENWVITSGKGKLNRALDLDFKLEGKKQPKDSLEINKSIITPDTLLDSTSLNK